MFILFVLSSLLFIGLGSNAAVVILTDGTTLEGTESGSISIFKGIPYAEAPINNLRFAPPKAWINPNVSQILDATKFGHACTQALWGDDGLFDDGSEDCLFLNVYVNMDYASSAAAPLPVGVFVHGGSYITGSSSLPLYEGSDMLDFMAGKAILVTLNYRLNVFGFLGSEALRSQDPESGSTGNYGIQDQRLAFDWVRANIGAFGGDSEKITIFGESAGAGSMSNHLTMKKSWSSFDQVILESGAFADWVVTPLSSAQTTYDAMLELLHCDAAHDAENFAKDGGVACLLGKSDLELKRAAMAYAGATSLLYAPVVDGVETVTHPWIALANGDVADVNILHGSNSDEGAIFTALHHDIDEEALVKHWTDFGYSAEEIEQLTALYVTDKTYPEVKWGEASVYWWAAQRSYGDDFMSCPGKYTSQQLSLLQSTGKRSRSTYFYHFEHEPRNTEVVRHVSELEFTFHQNELLRHPDDSKMADVMTSYWGNFFNSGNPNKVYINGPTLLPEWREYTHDGDETIAIRAFNDAPMVSGLKEPECDFAIARTDTKLRSIYYNYNA